MSSMKLVLLAAGLVIPVGSLVHVGLEKRREEARRRQAEEERAAAARRKLRQEHELQQLITEASDLARVAGGVGLPERAKVRARVLVVDAQTRKRSPATDLLPPERRAGPGERDISVVVITQRSNVKVKEYGSSRFGLPNVRDPNAILGYRVDLEVRVLDWPARKVVARGSIRGQDPPNTIMRRTFAGVPTDRSPEYGNSDTPLADWITSLPH
jgi:hypothetical protein